MADALISMLLERLASTTYEYIQGELKHVLNVKEDVEKFTGTLELIQAVLEDAEQRQVTEASVKIWLDKLKDISYQMVDVLDEWNTDILKQQVEKQEREGDPNALVTKKKYLERLTIRYMEGVRKVGVEFLGLEDQTSFRIRSPQILFPKLKQLKFLCMWNWEEWEGVEEWTKEDSEITIMPCLSELTIQVCNSLKALPDFVFKAPLQTLRIPESKRLLERYQEGNGEWAKISATNPNIRIIRGW